MTLVLNFGLPKGSLEEATIKLFGRAGFSISKSSRSYKPCWDDPELDGRFVRAQEMSRYVEDGFFDCGLTGRDWVRENRSDVEIVADLIYSRASNRISKWVLAVPEQSDVQTVKDLEGKSIATELVQVTRDYLKENEVEAEVEFSWGATEVKVPELVDAIVDLTETGSSLRANNLRVVDVLMENTKGPKHHITIKETRHLNYCDAPLFSPFVKHFLEIGEMNREKSVKLINEITLEFFNQHLRSVKSEVLNKLQLYQDLVVHE